MNYPDFFLEGLVASASGSAVSRPLLTSSEIALVLEKCLLQGYVLPGVAHTHCGVIWTFWPNAGQLRGQFNPGVPSGDQVRWLDLQHNLLSPSVHPCFLPSPSPGVDPKGTLNMCLHTTCCLGVWFLKNPNGNSNDTLKCLALPATELLHKGINHSCLWLVNQNTEVVLENFQSVLYFKEMDSSLQLLSLSGDISMLPSASLISSRMWTPQLHRFSNLFMDTSLLSREILGLSHMFAYYSTLPKISHWINKGQIIPSLVAAAIVFLQLGCETYRHLGC